MREDASSSQPPRSDVSAGVGIVGLAGLLGWIAFCRAFPDISTALDLPGPHARLAGPYAALCGLLASGVPMVLWSILVDKVHRPGSCWANRARHTVRGQSPSPS